jgi:hypothetical protein
VPDKKEGEEDRISRAAEAEPQAKDVKAPSVTTTREAVGRDEYAKNVARIKGTDVEAAANYLRKVMPSKEMMGVRLPGLGMLDPTAKGQWDEFLGSPDFAESRERLQTRIGSWIEILSGAEESGEAAETLDERIAALQQLFDKNQAMALDATRELERAYRMAAGFFANAQLEAGDKVDAWVYNAHPEKLLDPDDTTNWDALARAIQTEYRDFSMRKTFGLLCIPGWLGDVKKIDRLATLANQNKLTAITDAPDRSTGDALLEFLQADAFQGLMGAEDHKRNLCLCGNWVLARAKHVVEDDEMYIPPSVLLTGAIYRNDVTPKAGIQQSTAGYTYGKLQGAEATRFRVDRPLATELMAKHGVNAVVHWDGYPRVMGDQNLCNVDGFRSYSRIRVEDWIVKNLVNFLNYQAFKNITNDNLASWQSSMFRFLDEIRDREGGKAITNFRITVESTPEERRRGEVRVNLWIEFVGTARYFNLRVKEIDGGKSTAVEEKKG